MSELETPTVTPAESVPATPTFDAGDQHTWSSEQRAEWNKSGKQPSTTDSAPVNKEKAVPDPAPETEEKAADTASDPATDPAQKSKPNLKTKEDTEKRFRELLDENKDIKRQLAELAKTSAPRKQESQPAPERKAKTFDDWAKDNPNKTYEDFIYATARETVLQEIAAENQRRAESDARKQLTSKIEEAKTRYPDYDQERISAAVTTINDDPQIPNPVKAMLEHSDNFVDLIYVFSEQKALQELVSLAKTNPAAAIRKIVMTEQLVQAELSKGKTDATPARGEDGKFVSDKPPVSVDPKPRAPKPPSEVGGRGTAPDDVQRTAAEKGDYKSFAADMDRRFKAKA